MRLNLIPSLTLEDVSMEPIIKYVINNLKIGELDWAYKYREHLNNVAMTLYNKQSLDSNDVEDLKDLLLICNILYNDTDRSLLPIEDGIYDLLLEKYKTYDPNFQVGAEVLEFKSLANNSSYRISQENDIINIVDRPQEDLPFMKDIVVDMTNYIDARDFEDVDREIDTTTITKRKHEISHEHPELVGTLDKCKFVLDRDAIEKGSFDDPNVKTVETAFFRDHLSRGIISPYDRFDMILELKYDGVSVEADCTDEIVSARSRGDTGIGKASDFTPLLKGYRFPHREKNAPMIGVKFEAIITRYDLPRFNRARGYEYKNCRSAIVGLLSSSDAWKYRDFITLVPLAVEEKIYREVCHSDRLEEINFLNTNFVSKGCPLRHTVINGTYIENLAWVNIFTQNAESLRSMVPFMYDGIVLSYRDERIRQKLGRENYINKFSIAVKFNPLKKETIFRGYTYTIGQDGSVTPMIHYDPVEFYGTIHTKSSGHSYARFNELALHKGDIISVEYVNDVMPYVSRPINDFNLDNEKIVPLEVFPMNCPICNSIVEISSSNKSAKCTNPLCGGRQLSRMVNMCQKLGLDGFGESTIVQLGTYHLLDLIALIKQPSGIQRLQELGFGPVESSNIKEQIDRLITCPLNESQLLGSIGFTGISTKTWELILGKLKFYQLRDMIVMSSSSSDVVKYLSSIKGIGPATADTIVREFEYFRNDLEWMYSNANIQPYIAKQGKKIRMSGFRDPELAQYLTTLGFDVDMDAGVTKDVYALLVPNETYVSGKTKKATAFGIMVVPVHEFRENISKYI